MLDTLPMPCIPLLSADNALDLEALGSSVLETFVDVQHYTDGDFVYPNWRGCGADGEVIDDSNSPVAIDTDLIGPYGMPLAFDNALLKRLDQGWVFYSYALGDKDGPQTVESARRFFYVGQRPALAKKLPVVQVRGAHDLHLNALEIVNELPVIIMPYDNMTEGDTVELTWQGTTEAGVSKPEMKYSLVVVKEQLGAALKIGVPKAQALLILKGKAAISYTVAYTDALKPITQSMTQIFQILASTAPLLPAIEIPNVTTNLDPELYKNGLTLLIDTTPLMQAGDDIVFYASAPREGISKIIVVRADQTTMDRGYFKVLLEYGWLNSNTELDVTFTYEFSRLGKAGASVPLVVNISKERDLSALPFIPEATPEGEGTGSLTIAQVINGFEVNIPDSVELFPADEQHVRLNEEGAPGFYRGEPELDTPRVFRIPMAHVAPNIGKSVLIYYEISPGVNKPPLISPSYQLNIADLKPNQITPTSCTKPPSSGQISKQAVAAAGGAEFTQKAWPFFLEGQLVRLVAYVGVDIYYLRGSSSEGVAVTSAEFSKKAIVAQMSSTVIDKFEVNETLNVYAEISFDGGALYKRNEAISLTVVT